MKWTAVQESLYQIKRQPNLPGSSDEGLCWYESKQSQVPNVFIRKLNKYVFSPIAFAFLSGPDEEIIGGNSI